MVQQRVWRAAKLSRPAAYAPQPNALRACFVHGVSSLVTGSAVGRGKPRRSSHSRSQRKQRFASACAAASSKPSSTSRKFPSRCAMSSFGDGGRCAPGEVVEIVHRRDVVTRCDETRFGYLAGGNHSSTATATRLRARLPARWSPGRSQRRRRQTRPAGW